MSTWHPFGGSGTHLDVALTNISVGISNLPFAGGGLFPVVPVQRVSEKYYIFGNETWVPEEFDVRAPGAEASEIGAMRVSADQYYVSEHSLQGAVPDEDRENVDNPFHPDRDTTELLTSKILMGREVLIKNMVTTAANYASGHSATVVNKWDSITTS